MEVFFRMYYLCGYEQYWAQFHPKSVQQWVLYGNSLSVNKAIALLISVWQKTWKQFEPVTHTAVCSLELASQMALCLLSSEANICTLACVNWISSSIEVLPTLVSPGVTTIPSKGAGVPLQLEKKRYRSYKTVLLCCFGLDFFSSRKSKFRRFQFES